jgi:hypothetical protein
MATRYGWHIISSSRQLLYGDGRKVRIGQRLEFKRAYLAEKPRLCSRGMHASGKAPDANLCWNQIYSKSGDWQSRMGWLCRVKVEGTNYRHLNYVEGKIDGRFIGGPSKFVGTHRTVLGMMPLSKARDIGLHKTKDILAEMQKRNDRNGTKTKVR